MLATITLICFAGPFTSDNGNEEADNKKACVDQDGKDNHEEEYYEEDDDEEEGDG